MIDLSYVITPFFAWLVAGCLKFAVNTIRARRLAFDLIGYGGFPSNHSAIVSSAVVMIALKEGLQSPALLVAITVAFVVMLDAKSLRRNVGRHAEAINKLTPDSAAKLRERMGHTPLEIAAGAATGAAAAWFVFMYFA